MGALRPAALAVALAAALNLAPALVAAATPPIAWRHSKSVGLPWRGRLEGGVQLPAHGRHFFTWDPALRRAPNRPWRRWGSDRLVRTVLGVVRAYARAHPKAPRVGIGDLSRPRGGEFGPRFGGLGHASHQNGLDVDVYYPRRDRRERAPIAVGQIDRRLAQDLVDRFVRAGATDVFVGPNTRLHGRRGVVERLVHHDNHLHFRLRPARSVVGRSWGGRPVAALETGNAASPLRVLVVGCIHGDECAGRSVTRLLFRTSPDFDLWLLPTLNPDGAAARTRQNARGVDLNRNFGSQWRPGGRPWDGEYGGPRAFSERESRIARRLVERLRPAVTIWLHQPQAVVRAWGGSMAVAACYARLARMSFRAIAWPPGSAPNWQNHRFPGSASFVVELPPGPLEAARARRLASAVLLLPGCLP